MADSGQRKVYAVFVDEDLQGVFSTREKAEEAKRKMVDWPIPASEPRVVELRVDPAGGWWDDDEFRRSEARAAGKEPE